MAITKLSNIGTPQGGGAAHLKNCISYILKMYFLLADPTYQYYRD